MPDKTQGGRTEESVSPSYLASLSRSPFCSISQPRRRRRSVLLTGTPPPRRRPSAPYSPRLRLALAASRPSARARSSCSWASPCLCRSTAHPPDPVDLGFRCPTSASLLHRYTSRRRQRPKLQQHLAIDDLLHGALNADLTLAL
jgi:hypothetical protein